MGTNNKECSNPRASLRRFLRRTTLVAAVSAAIFGLNGSAFGVQTTNNFDQVVAQKLAKPGKGSAQVIVQLEGALNEARQKQLANLGGDIQRQFKSIQAIVLTLPEKNLKKLTELDWVKNVSWDRQVRKADDFTVGSSYAQQAWTDYGTNGMGVTMAVVDSGIQPAPDLSGGISSRVIAHVSFADPDLDPVNDRNLQDPCGHGTHVAGIAAGNGKSSRPLFSRKQYLGIAPQVNLVSVRVLQADGSGTVSGVIAGLEWIIANQKTYNIKIVNMSLGAPVTDHYSKDPLCQMVEALWKRGIFVAVAAGNNGRLNSGLMSDSDMPLDNEGYGTAYGSIQSPGNSPYVMTVGAMKRGLLGRSTDRIATYSSRGPSILDYVMKPDIVAPGNLVVSIGPEQGFLFNRNGSTNTIPLADYIIDVLGFTLNGKNPYFRLSGTSMATPVVAGAAAMMLQREPWLTPDTIKARLMVAATKLTHDDNVGDPCSFGAGYIDIPSAMASTFVANDYALSPQLQLDKDGNLVLDIEGILGGNRAIWGTNIMDPKIIWGTRAIWGSVGGTRAIWGLVAGQVGGTRAIWGTTGILEANRAMWGSATPVVDLTNIAIDGEN